MFVFFNIYGKQQLAETIFPPLRSCVSLFMLRSHNCFDLMGLRLALSLEELKKKTNKKKLASFD